MRPTSLRVLLLSFVLFFPMAPLATLVHELGHIGVAEMLGHDATLHHSSMSWSAGDAPAPARHEHWITLGGPFVGALLGTAGLLLLVGLRRRASPDAPLGVQGWAALLLALFWSRPVFNTGLLLIELARTDEWPFRSDETWLGIYWGLPLASIDIGSALVGLAACWMAAISLPPRWMVTPLLAGGVAGALAGYTVWFHGIGPILLP